MDVRSICRARAARIAGLFLVLIGSSASATLSPAVQNGVNWLHAQVQGSGALQNEATSIAAPLQAREETELTLQLLDHAPSALIAALSADKQATNEFAARRQLAAAGADLSDNADVNALLAQQNADGGWGMGASYQSNPLDTALALQALRSADAAASAQVSAALTYLTQTKLSDGGWGVTDRSSVYVDSHVLLAAQGWAGQNAAGAGIAADASTWLVGARDANQQYGDAFDNATALIALAGQPAQSAALAPLANALSSTQLADGSWADDPYVTALALRGLWLSGQVPVTPTSGNVLGLVVDQATNAALSGVAVQLAQNAGFNTTTSASGAFQLGAVPAGSYTLTLSATGYATRSLTIQIVGGQTLNLGTIGLAKNVTTASLYGSVHSNTGAALQGVLVAVGSRSVLTDATGAYQLDGIPPGAATVSASLVNYQTASASVTFVANTTYRFSPTLYPNNTPPPATSLQGHVVDAVTNAAIVGASVTLNGTTQLTAADGSFRFSPITAGAFALSVSASGYQTVTVSGSAVAGANDVGAIGLNAQLGTSTLQGKVLDANNAPIGNATVAIAQGPSATTDNTGAYQLAGLNGTQFTVQVSATGYIAQTTMFSITAPGNYAQDFHLVAQQTNQVTLGPLTVAPPSAGANADVSVSATLFNGGSAPVSGVLMLEVRDANGAIVGVGPLTDTNALSIGAVTVQANASLGIIGRWNTGQFAPGTYQFELRFVAPGSISRSNPLGTLIQNQFAPFTIVGTTHFNGTVAGNPPIVQAGTNQAMDITAALKNDGNLTFAAQPLTLTVRDSRTGTVAYTNTVTVGPLDVNALTAVDFGNWLPAAGGNFTLSVSAADASEGRVSGTAYVGNVAQSQFTVTPSTVVAGTRTVHGDIHITGVDPSQATVSDPLAPLIRQAIQQAVTYNDTAAHAWIDRNQCSSCHIGNQALLGGELTRNISTYNALDRSVILNNISSNQAPNGGIWEGYSTYGAYGNRLGSLSLWGLLGYHDLAEFPTVLKRAGDWVAGFQAGNGEWYSDWNGAWFDNDISMAMLNISNLHHVDSFLRGANIASVPTYSTATRFASQPRNARGSLIVASSGNIYYSDSADGAVHELKPDGTQVAQWTGFNDPRGVVELADGQLWLASAGGTFRLNADGSSTKLSTLNLDDLFTSPDRTTVWAMRWGDTTIYRLDANGVPTAWLAPGPTSYMGYPTIDADGSIYIPDFYSARIYRVAPDKTVTVATELIQGTSPPNLWSLMKDGDHWLLSTSDGIYRMGSEWQAQRLTWSSARSQLAKLADGTVIYVNQQAGGLQQLVPQSEDVAPSLVNYAHAIDIGERWLEAQTPGDALHIAEQLWGLGEAYRYYLPLDAVRAASIKTAMQKLDTKLRALQNADGGWGSRSDALITAMSGIALDYLNPSPSDPAVRKAVTWLLTQQQGDGSWYSVTGIMGTRESTTTLVAIWLPTILDRLGAIDVQATAVFPRNIQPSAIVPAPDSTATDASGNLTVIWQLTGVTIDGRDLNFDLTLDDMQPNEVRAAASDAHLAFNNSFSQSIVTVPIAIPNVNATGPVSLTVVTDKPAYPANATAQVTTTLSNIDLASVTGDLAVDVYDANGALVGPVTHQSGVSIPAQGSLPVTAPFAIGTIPPATYTVKATLTHGAQVLAQGTTHFDVLPDSGSGSATSTLHTDKQVYNPSDSVQILSGVTSLSSNVTLNNLSLGITVVDANGATQFTHTTAVPQLSPAQTLHYTTIETLTDAAPGVYTVKQDLRDAQGGLYNHVEVTYTVSSSGSTGFGLSGTITASPKKLPIGALLTLTGAATNNGNASLDNLPLTITLVDPNGVAVAQFTQTSTVAIGATVPFVPTWTTQGSANTTYTAVLSATVGTNTITLASDTFMLTTSIKADVKLATGSPPLAALVLLDPAAPAADATRITSELAARHYVATFVTTATAFDSSLRTGAYSLYLVLADVPLAATTQRLLREAVHRGEGLLVANGSAALPDALAQVSGLGASNALLPIAASSLDVLANAPGGSAHVAFNPTLAARVVAPTTAQTEATLTGRLSATPDTGTLAQEVANLGRVDVGYFGSDAGTNNTGLALTSQGRIKNADGSDHATVWLIRNSGGTAANVTLASVASGYSQALTITAHTDTFVASPIVAGTAAHKLNFGSQTFPSVAATTATFSDARLVDVGVNPGAIALWANHINATGDLVWDGAQHELHGAIHSNADLSISGAQNTIDGPVHYVTTFTNNGSQNTFTYLPRQVAPQPLPTLLNPDDYKPGGAVARAVGAAYVDATAECASKHVFKRNPNDFPLASGVYWIPCDVQFNGSSLGGNITVVTTGALQISGSKGAFTPYYDSLQFVSTAAGTAMHFSGSSLGVGGFVYAPNGLAQMDGSAMTFSCAIVADTIRLAGAKTVIDARQCAQATVQEKTPAVLRNAYGAGSAAYAAFAWAAAIDKYEATPGELTQLFDGVIGQIAPTQTNLRGGSIVPLTATVTRLADPFTGSLALSLDDNGAFVPPTATWALDFTTQTSVQQTTNVRLGSGTSTTVSAKVAAATPIVIDPLAQTSTTIPHLASDSIANLIAAANAIGSPDAGITAAIVALNAAQSSQTAGDASGMLGHLLDAADACGASTNAQADALRTRIDWVIWTTTH